MWPGRPSTVTSCASTEWTGAEHPTAISRVRRRFESIAATGSTLPRTHGMACTGPIWLSNGAPVAKGCPRL